MSSRIQSALSKIGRNMTLRKISVGYSTDSEATETTITTTHTITAAIVEHRHEKDQMNASYSEVMNIILTSSVEVTMKDVVVMDSKEYRFSRLEPIYRKSTILCYDADIIR